MKSRKGVVMRVICGVVALLAVVARGEIFIPDGKIRGDDYTVLMAVDAPLPLGCKKFEPSGHGKFYVYEWRRSSQLFYWEVEGEQAGDYHVNVLLSCNNKSALRVRVSCAGSSVDGVLEGAAGRWRRLALDGLLRIPAGRHTVKLEALEPEFAASVMSLELVVPDVRERLHNVSSEQLIVDIVERESWWWGLSWGGRWGIMG